MMATPPDQALAADLRASVPLRYRAAGRFARHYVASKLRHDPLLPALLRLAQVEHFGDIVDVGCGRGQFSAALLQAGLARAAIGLDCRATFLAQARHAMGDLPFQARMRDLSANPHVPDGDTILLIDILYQLETSAQHALLLGAAAACRKRLIIRTADPNSGVRSTVTRWLERAGRRIWPHAGATVNARGIGEITETISSRGFVCSVTPCWFGTVFSNVLIVAERKRREEERLLF